MSFLFLSSNENKLREVQAILGSVTGLALDLPEIQSLDPHEVIRAKLNEALSRGYRNVLVEDTSLSFQALHGLPGPFIKWFLEALGAAGLAELCVKLGDTRATATTIFGLARKNGEVLFSEGVVEGTIVTPRGAGFGWDSIFQPLGWEKTFGEMDASEKERCSARASALAGLKDAGLKEGLKEGLKDTHFSPGKD